MRRKPRIDLLRFEVHYLCERIKTMALSLKPKDLTLINQHLKELAEIKKDLEDAKELKLPGAEQLMERVAEAETNCVNLKHKCFPNSK